MKELNELVEQAKRANVAGQGTPEMADFRVTASPDNIIAIAEAFQALEQRAEAAESKADCYEKSAKYAAATNKKLTAKMSAMCDTIQQLKHQLEEKSRE